MCSRNGCPVERTVARTTYYGVRMGPGTVRGLLLLAVTLPWLGSCSEPPRDEIVGSGYLVVSDISGYSGRFEAGARNVTAQLVLHENGCVNVISGGVERVPFWPDGSTVTQDGKDSGQYLVTVPGGTTLVARQHGGDTFTAQARTAPAGSASSTTGAGSKAESILRYCVADGGPIAFDDPASFRRAML